MIEHQIIGLDRTDVDEVRRNLATITNDFNQRDRRSIYRNSLRQASQALRDLIEARTPVDTGLLRQSTRVAIRFIRERPTALIGWFISPEIRLYPAIHVQEFGRGRFTVTRPPIRSSLRDIGQESIRDFARLLGEQMEARAEQIGARSARRADRRVGRAARRRARNAGRAARVTPADRSAFRNIERGG